MTVGGGADIYAGAARIEILLICLGELNAPKSCWSVLLGTRQRSACREEFAPSSKTPLAIQSCCHSYLRGLARI